MEGVKEFGIQKIAVFYGHVASNLGDLAINVGELEALKRSYPDATVKFIALHIDEGPVYEQARAETARVGDADWSIFRTSFRHISTYLSKPRYFLEQCGIEDCDLIILASGEHLFAYEDNPNIRSLYWRSLPAIAAKAVGKKTLLFPSTLGPYETDDSRSLIASLLGTLDGLAVREQRSADYLEKEFDTRPRVLPDPAFFLEPTRKRSLNVTSQDVLGLVMRSEDWGIRLSKDQRIDTQHSDGEATTSGQQALAFSLSVINHFLALKTEGQVRVFVQTAADENLAESLLKCVEEGSQSKISIIKPDSISTYLDELASLDLLISSRFHALILAMVTQVPVYGVYFTSHGHKVPGLFSWLDLPSFCQCIESDAEQAAREAVDKLLNEPIDWDQLNGRIEDGKEAFSDWLDTVQKQTQSEVNLLGATLALNALAAELVEFGYEQQQKAFQKKTNIKLEGSLKKEFQDKLEKLEDQLTLEFKDTIKDLEFKKVELEYSVEDLEKQKRNFQQDVEYSERARAKLEFYIESLSKEKEAFQQEIEKLLKENAELENRFQVSNKKSEAFQKEVEALTKTVELLHRDSAQLRGQLENIRGSSSYQLAAEAARTLRSRHKVLSLPLRLYGILRETREARGVSAPKVISKDEVQASGTSSNNPDDPKGASSILVSESKTLSAKGQYKEALELASRALALYRSETTLRAVFWAQQSAGDVASAYKTVLELQEFLGKNPSMMQKQRMEFLFSQPSFQLHLKEKLPAKIACLAYEPVKDRIAYILHNGLPFSSGGYATRAQGLARGLSAQRYEVIAFTRPGYPLDINKKLNREDVKETEDIDGITYVRTLEPSRRNLKMKDFVPAATDVYVSHFKKYKPEVVVAASNYICALPALFAARRLGLPFVYEVRGFWEITRLSREPGFINHPSYKIQELMEAFVCNAADQVLTLTDAMRTELTRRGVDEAKIEIVPNACEPELFQPRDRDGALAEALGIPGDVPVIGYIGTFVDYEGLEDLARACGLLKEKGQAFRLLLVGNENVSGAERGPISQAILDAADRYQFRDWLIMPGRVPHEQVSDYYSLIDIAPFPRKPWPVCEMVSPMKPLEAMAMEKTVVVSSVSALAEMVGQGQYGVIFEKGNERALADALSKVIINPELRSRLGKSGREHVLSERTWLRSSERFSGAITTRPPGFEEVGVV